MSDYNDLIKRLRSWDGCWPADGLERNVAEAADALEAQAEVIFKLEKAYQEAREELTAAYLCGYERAKSEHAARKALEKGDE